MRVFFSTDLPVCYPAQAIYVSKQITRLELSFCDIHVPNYLSSAVGSIELIEVT